MKNWGNKLVFLCFLLLFITSYSFGLDNINWSTVRPTIQGVNVNRIIPMSSVKTEFFRVWEEYSFIDFSDSNINHRSFNTRLAELFVSQGPGFRQFHSWLINNRNYVICYPVDWPGNIRNIEVNFIIGDYVYGMTFNNIGNGSRTNNRQLRREFEVWIDDLLRGL
ncbi:MAG: hypothetical protein FWD47_09280 [Treponema sp.]|nr:hypothetical protein [Treponema sp.]